MGSLWECTEFYPSGSIAVMQKFCHGWSEAVHWVGKFFISNIIQSSNMWYYQELMVKQHQQTIGSWFRKFFWDWHFFPAHDASTVPGSFTVCSSVSTIFFSWYQIGQIQTRYKQEIFEHKSFWRLGGGVCFMFIFTPNLGEIIQFDLYFVGLKPPNFWASPLPRHVGEAWGPSNWEKVTELVSIGDGSWTMAMFESSKNEKIDEIYM